MHFTRVILENWRNFTRVDVRLARRVFLAGPNAAGKSNFLDAFRFLRDVADPQGGLQRAVESRDGMPQLRSLHARARSHVGLEVEVDLGNGQPWSYRLEIAPDSRKLPVVRVEAVRHGDACLLSRPDTDDRGDATRLSQTHLEQVNANREFRPLQEAFAGVKYLHVVPQLVREPERSVGRQRDPFGGDFLEQIAKTSPRQRDARLRRIRDALKVAVPQLAELKLERDRHTGVPHLQGLYSHWRPDAGWQSERQFSDGTLRLIGLLWGLLDGDEPLLLEEPELSLHPGIVRCIPSMMAKLGLRLGRQVIVSTHSKDLLSDEGLAAEEVLLFQPTREDTKVTCAADDAQVVALLEGGVSMAEAVVPRTAPAATEQLLLFGE